MRLPVVERVVGKPLTVGGVDAQDLAREPVDVLRAQRQRVDGRVARAVAGGDVQHAVRPELEVADRVAEPVGGDAVSREREVLARWVGLRADRRTEQHELRARARDIAGRRAGVDADHLRRLLAAQVAGVVLPRVGDIHPAVRGEVRIQREADQAAIAVVVDVRDGVVRRRQQRAVLEDLDRAVLLADEDAPVRREREHRRQVQPGDRGIRDEAAQIGPVLQVEDHHRAARVFVVLDDHRVRSRRHLLVDRMRVAPLIDPEVQDQLPINVHTRTVVTGGRERVDAFVERKRLRPASAEVIGRDRTRRGRAQRPVEIDRRIVAGQRGRARERLVREVLAGPHHRQRRDILDADDRRGGVAGVVELDPDRVRARGQRLVGVVGRRRLVEPRVENLMTTAVPST